MPEQRIISADSQILNAIQKCAEFTNLAFIQNVTPQDKAEPLERGDLMHKLLEIYYGCIGACAREDSETWKLLSEHLGVKPPFSKYSPSMASELALSTVSLFAAPMNLPVEEIEEIAYQFGEYAKFFEHDGWNPLAVEEVGAKILHEDDELKIIYNVKIDLIAEQGKLIAPWDHKTSKRRQEPSSLSNQFMGYAWALGKENVLVNKIGFQKTLKPQERFQRHILSYTVGRLEEWRKNAIWWLKMLDYHVSANDFPMNLTSCDKYSGCIFQNICDKDKDSRSWMIERDFKKNEPWDPGKGLENEKH